MIDLKASARWQWEMKTYAFTANLGIDTGNTDIRVTTSH